jgi:hypothetical protein
MKRRFLALLVALGLVAGLLVAVTGTAAADPCFIQNSVVVLEEDNPQTVCVFNVTQVDISQEATTGEAGDGGTSGDASNTATVENTTTQNVETIMLLRTPPPE